MNDGFDVFERVVADINVFHCFADAGNLPQARLVEAREVVGVVGRDVGGISIRPNLEWVVALDL
ncbi:MAG: hypothetical protein RIS64_2517, partial [Bacteroidota bacterium]